MYSFSFESGAAKIVETATGNVVLLQPFKPINAGQQPWGDADEARTWVEENFPQYFIDYPEPLPPSEGPLTPPEPVAQDSTPAQGE